MRQEELLINRLAAYARSDMYPFQAQDGAGGFLYELLRGLLYKSLCSGYNGD